MVGAPGAPSHSPSTTGWPAVGTTCAPANRSCPASHWAAVCIVSCSASRLTLGTATNSASSRRYRASPGSKESIAAVNRDRLPGHPGGLLGGEEQHAVGDVGGLAQPAHRDAVDQCPLAVGAVALPLPDAGRVRQHEAGGDAVDRDPERAELACHLAGEADLGGLRAGVGLDPGLADAEPGRRGDRDDPAPAAL